MYNFSPNFADYDLKYRMDQHLDALYTVEACHIGSRSRIVPFISFFVAGLREKVEKIRADLKWFPEPIEAVVDKKKR